MNTYIEIENISLKFRIYKNPVPSLKEALVHFSFHPKKRADNYMEFYALKDINLSIKGGQRIGIIGLNGAGKSTLLKTIAGIYTPQFGQIRINGRVTPLMELGAGFHPEQTGRDNIYVNGSLYGKSHQEMKSLEGRICEFSELDDFLNLPVKYYSSGMYIRLAFSIATMMEPDILIVDEVLAAGDAHFIGKASKRMQELIESSQIVLLVSHNLDQIASICNEVIVLHKGEIVNQGKPKDMIEYYTKELVK
jgi:ABC-type polysaccharide/polyol phosphate transport system ATPase subunit